MSQFNYLNEINNALTMDGDLNRCPAPRWQKKTGDMSSTSMLNGSINTSKLSQSYGPNFSALGASMSSKTPQKNGGATKTKKTPNGKGGRSPNRQKTPSNGGDRFIPNRAASNFEIGHYLIKQEQQAQQAAAAAASSSADNIASNQQQPPKPPTDHQLLLSEALHGGDVNSRRLFSFQEKAPAAPDFHQNPLRVVYSVTKTPNALAKANNRHIPQSPERILDAPDIINDYYLNLMDWSNSNVVTVALGKVVYLWNATTGNIEQLREYDNGDHACSLSWIQQGHILAIGNNEGAVELWDCEVRKRLRVMDGHTARIGALAWNSFTVSSGSRDGSIVHHDVRQREHAVAELRGHTQEVCGLKWSPDYKYLASGGNDNIVNVWSGSGSSGQWPQETVHVFNEHQAAVRALAWCPWQTHVLATGGGTADRCIKFWNVNTGAALSSVDTQSQVCALLWSKTYKELVSAHGYANNQLTIWKYPSMVKQAELTGHTSRVLQIAMSPDGSTVMSAAADETLRLWNCFAPDAAAAKKKSVLLGGAGLGGGGGGGGGRISALKQSIR